MASDPNELLAAATAHTGLPDFGDNWFLGPLAAWCKDLSGEHISERGRGFLTRLAVSDLARRAEIVDCLRRNPEIEATPVPPILYITGHERSGTTLLHNLLSQHRDARYLSRWELMMPTPPPEAGALDDDPRRALVQKSVDALRGSDLESMHWVEADDPEECVWGFMDCTGLLGQAPAAIMPNWFEWLGANDLTPTFRNYRKIIQILIWKNPVPENGFLVLKAPQISRCLTAFGAVFPEARFVLTHRDPFRAVTSTCTLVDIVNAPFLSDKAYFERLEKTEGRIRRAALQKYAEMQRFDDANSGRVINIGYGDLVEDPAQEIAKVFAHSILQTDAGMGAKVEGFITSQRKGRRAAPRKEIRAFGYAQDEFLADPRTAAYVERYGVGTERTRQTGAA